ncbi:catalase [Simiduia sp. 21SJ11W-1]|uniref:putative metalloprotease CJM1_0395 family protein n=1 Tax=Simiduia sp. 21SJ11W-1 TaxID=2909669 RepID=UPI0020A05B54|nr:putative metalloprotease CJM1_0395 family protein [Simiduia sp. 21SJ11W-1]UTA47538.1 catalase [Simiduia sp. 21SJ11W-1]
MNINLPPNFGNMVSPFNPLGRTPVGEQEQDGRPTTFKAVEEGAETARAENRTREDDTHREQALGDNKPRTAAGSRSGSEDAEAVAGPGSAPAQVAVSGAGALAEDQSASERIEAEQEQREIAELAARDREVRAHERAHAAVGGQHTGAPQYTYVRGPDGVAYAVSGEVSVRLGAIAGNPEATLQKAEQIQQAALAPADPSAQDRLIAAKAAQLAEQARADIRAAEQQARQEQEAARAEQREARAEQERQDEQAREAREQLQAEQRLREAERQRAVELSQRLLRIGVEPGPRAPGELLDQRV